MTHAEILAYNAGVADLAAIAEAAADALRTRITEAPTRFNFAIAALDGIVEAAGDLKLPLPPNETEPSTACPPAVASTSEGWNISEKKVAHG